MQVTYEEIKRQPSPDFKKRTGPWVGIIIHHTGLPKELPRDTPSWIRYGLQMVDWLTKKDNAYVSAHFVIDRDGSIVMTVDPEYYCAFHAGISSFWHPLRRMFVSSWNNHSVGIELVGDGNRIVFSEKQYDACGWLCSELMRKYSMINPQCIVGHEVISPGRKQDPGFAFDWRKLYRLIYLNQGV